MNTPTYQLICARLTTNGQLCILPYAHFGLCSSGQYCPTCGVIWTGLIHSCPAWNPADSNEVRSSANVLTLQLNRCGCQFNAEWPEPPSDPSVAWAFEECGYHKDMRERLKALANAARRFLGAPDKPFEIDLKAADDLERALVSIQEGK